MSTRQVTADGKFTKPAVRSAPVPIIVPKGDPLLGEKLAHMAKDARKQYKSTDADRVARRLAKKKARNALGNSGVKTQGKDRERVRKAPSTGKAAAPKKRESKGKVRSDKSMAKRNAKK
jgi:nucleolar protein 12